MDDKIHFNTGSAEIATQSHELLNEIARVLRENPRITKVRIEGHTDNVGTAALNRRLSQQRALSVVSYLQQRGVRADRLAVMGIGKRNPLPGMAATDGRNRRVEIVPLQ